MLSFVWLLYSLYIPRYNRASMNDIVINFESGYNFTCFTLRTSVIWWARACIGSNTFTPVFTSFDADCYMIKDITITNIMSNIVTW